MNSVSIPVRKGGEVVAYAIVSRGDAARIAAHSWSLTGRGYAQTFAVVDGKKTSTSMHRMVAGLNPGDPGVVHHRNEAQLDNRRSNLEVFRSQSPHIRLHRGTDSFEKQGQRLARAVGVAARKTIAASRHDLAGYRSRGCRCDECRAAHSRHVQKFYKKRIGKQPPSHGRSGYTNWACRCDVCRAANSEASRQRRDRARAAA